MKWRKGAQGVQAHRLGVLGLLIDLIRWLMGKR